MTKVSALEYHPALTQGLQSGSRSCEVLAAHRDVEQISEKAYNARQIPNGLTAKMAHGFARAANPATRALEQQQSPTTNGAGMIKEADTSDELKRSEASYLKQLLMVHLEMIQRQHCVIASRDAEIRTLRSEKAALLTRLERMNRRVGLPLTRTAAPASLVAEQSEAGEAAGCRRQGRRRSISEPEESAPESADADKNEQLCRNAKRSKQLDQAPGSISLHHCHRGNLSTSRRKHHGASCRRRGLACAAAAAATDSFTAAVPVAESSTESPVYEPSVGFRRAIPKERSAANEAAHRPPSPIPPADGVLRSSLPYFTRQGEVLPPSIDDDPVLHCESQAVVEVPTWRLLTFSNCYSLEGTENLEDEIFHKMHQKHETDEKRRKRWDLQRLRDQQVLEKLQGRSGDSKLPPADKAPMLDTLFPQACQARIIEVAEELPVNAFGCTVPYVQQSDFRLPWVRGKRSTRFTGNKRQRAKSLHSKKEKS